MDSKRNYSEADSLSFPDTDSKVPFGSGIRQKCPSTCNILGFFLTVFFIVMLLTFIITLPTVTGTLRFVSFYILKKKWKLNLRIYRCVPDTHRSYALGIRGIIVRLLGTIPGPIIFGYILDTTCVLWQETCNRSGSCRLYDNSKMSKWVILLFRSKESLFQN